MDELSDDFQPRVQSAVTLLGGIGQIVRVWSLKGGISAKMTGIALDDGQKFALREPGEFARKERATPARWERDIYAALHATRLPVPQPVALDSDGMWFVIRYIEGAPNLRPTDLTSYLARYAQQLATIHLTPLTDELTRLLPRQELILNSRPNPLRPEFREPEVWEALEFWGHPPQERVVLRHGDYWPGNVIWSEGEIAGVVDWEEASVGEALTDLSIARLDVAWAFGFEAMEIFTRDYLRVCPVNTSWLPYWDLRTSQRINGNFDQWAASYSSFGRDDITGETMRTVYIAFVEAALR